MSNYKKISQIISNTLELLFPGNCMICGDKLIFNSMPFYLICNSCMDNLEYISGKRCICCSAELISEIDICTRCRNIKYHFDSNISIFEYRGDVKDIIYQYKFKKRVRISMILADLLIKTIQEFGLNLPIVPVPSASKKDHIDKIAGCLKKKYNIKVINCLKRKGAMQQKQLDFEERFNNLKDKISVKHDLIKGIEEVILVDDIITTGATANECSRVLKTCGVKKVYVATIAIDL